MSYNERSVNERNLDVEPMSSAAAVMDNSNLVCAYHNRTESSRSMFRSSLNIVRLTAVSFKRSRVVGAVDFTVHVLTPWQDRKIAIWQAQNFLT